MVDGSGVCRGAGSHELLERDHELRATLFGIEAVARALTEQRELLPSRDVDQLAMAIASEARRLQFLLEPVTKRFAAFDLAEAIQPAIVMARSLGVVVRNTVPRGTCILGFRDDTTQVVFALLDNARVHAAGSAIDLSATSHDGLTTLYVEDRGPGIAGAARRMFQRGWRGARSSGSGLGLAIANRLTVDQGGSLSVEARLGGGASFALSLPTAPSASPERQRRVAAPQSVIR